MLKLITSKSKLAKTLMAFVALPVLAAVPMVMSGCSGPKPDPKKTEVKAPPSPYSTIANGKVDVEGGVIEVAARRAGVVQDVFVQEGDEVVKGQILAQQDAAAAKLSVARSSAAVQEALTATRLTQIRIDTAKRELERLEKLAADNYVAVQKLDAARDAVKEAEATLAQQQAGVASARAGLAQAQYDLELTRVVAPMDGRIVRRYANPGAGASTLNVSTMFDLEPKTERIVRSEIVESAIPDVKVGQEAEIIPEVDQTKIYVGTVKRIAATFGARKLKSDSGNEASDERVVEVVVTADGLPFLIGQRVLVKFMKPGEKAGIKRETPKPATPEKK